MEEQRARGGPALGWRYGPPWWRRDGDGWPWRSTAFLTAVVVIGSSFASREQKGHRAQLDIFAVVLLLIGCALLLWRTRRPVPSPRRGPRCPGR